MDVKCVFYSDFNIDTGPELIYQTPNEFMANDLFKKISFYLIPNKDLCGQLCALRLDPALIYMGLPVEILNEKKYVRRSQEFNFGIIISYEQYQDPDARQVYQQLLRKIATYLTIMEVDHELIWIPERKRFLKDFVQTIYERLNNPKVLEQGSFSIPFDYTNSFTFHFKPKKERPPEVKNHDVPIFLSEEVMKVYASIVDITSDLLQQKIQPHIDGRKHVKQISIDCNMDLEIVRLCIQHLLYYKVVALIDIFQFSNIYSSNRSITKFAFDKKMQEECIAYVKWREAQNLGVKGKQQCEEEEFDMCIIGNNEAQAEQAQQKEISERDSQSKGLNPIKVVSLFSEISSGIKVSEFLLKHAHHEEGISKLNIKFYIEFGLLNGLIYRIHKYALLDQSKKKTTQGRLFGGAGANMRTKNNDHYFGIDFNQVQALTVFDKGGHQSQSAQKLKQFEQMIQQDMPCFDQICVELEMSLSELEKRIQGKDNIVTFYK